MDETNKCPKPIVGNINDEISKCPKPISGNINDDINNCPNPVSDDIGLAASSAFKENSVVEIKDISLESNKKTIPMDEGKKESTESDSKSSENIPSLANEYIFCQICGKNITNYSSDRRKVHVNKCCDLADLSQKEASSPKPRVVLLDKPAASNNSTSERVKCLLCFKTFVSILRFIQISELISR